MTIAAPPSEIEPARGDASEGRAETTAASVDGPGPPSHFIDIETAELRRVGMEFRDAQQIRLMLTQREVGDRIVREFGLYEERVRARLKKTLAAHPLWPWLKQFPGLGGANTALLIGQIADPRRFPGQKCTVGHYLPPFYEVGSSCPLQASEDRAEIEHQSGGEDSGAAERPLENVLPTGCPGMMLAPRRGTGVRAVWHYCGVHVEADGRAARRQKGQQASWNPMARTAVMMPDGGIATQIVWQRVPIYRDAYEAAKERLAKRGATATEGWTESAVAPGARLLRPFEIDHIAQVIAAKMFVGDLLVQWKSISS